MPELHQPRTWRARDAASGYGSLRKALGRQCPACGQWIIDNCPEAYYVMYHRVPETAALQHVQEAHPPPPPDPSWAAWWPVPP